MQTLLYIFLSSILIGVMIWAIRAYYVEHIEIDFNYVLYKKRITLRESDARKVSIFYFLGSLIMFLAISLHPIFNIKLEYFGIIFCASGLIFWGLAVVTILKVKNKLQ